MGIRSLLALLALVASEGLVAFDSETKWISAPGNEAPAFEKEFSVPEDIASASLEISAPGFYEAYLDGKHIGERVLDPSPTDFSKRVFKVSLPLEVVPGRCHVLKILLGHGWYDQRAVSAWDNHLDRWRAEPCVKAEIVFHRRNDSYVRIGTNREWRQVKSPLVWDDLREGEIVDPGFVLPRKGVGEFAVEVAGPKGKIVAMDHPPAKIVRVLSPVGCWRVQDGWMIDFGENLAGWARMKFYGGKRGDIVTIRYDERIQRDGKPCVRVERKDVPRRNRMELWPDRARAIDCYVFKVGSTNILSGGDMQQDRFILSGAAKDFYEPRFTYHGFRYVCVRGVEQKPDAEACEIHTDFATPGRIESSCAELDKLLKMVDRSYRSNFTDGFPTDCPHREKNGWTGDAQIACEFAQYAYENTAAYLKWIQDIVDAQRDDGALPGIVPSGGWGFGGNGYGPVWDSAIAIVPWNLYMYRNDDRGLKIAREALVKNVRYHLSNLGEDGLVRIGLGDWITCGHYSDHRFCGSAYLYEMLRVAIFAEKLFGNIETSKSFAAAAVRLRADFNREFYKGDGLYGEGYQTQQALPMMFGLIPPDCRQAVAQRLVEAVHAADDHIDFGLVGSKHVFRALSECGKTDLALKMLLQKSKPSIAQWSNAGSSTLWEDWETGFSRNHVMFGDFAAWAYAYVAGVRPVEPGFRKFEVRPCPPSALSWVRAEIPTPHGTVSVEWKKSDGNFVLAVAVPEGTSATVVMPSGKKHEISPGAHTVKEQGKQETVSDSSLPFEESAI